MYITFYKTIQEAKFKPKQLTIEDFLLNRKFEPTKETYTPPEGKIITAYKEDIKITKFFIEHFNKNWYNIPKHPSWPVTEIHKHYHSFDIPKKTGGKRHIDAPDPELKNYLTQLKLYFEDTLKILTHDAAHAYVKRRSTITALERHQTNKSKWFLKLDLKDFFPSHNIEYTIKCLEQIYPIGMLMHDVNYRKAITEALEYAFLDNKLPQGTPLSPTLTNICMTPLDYKIQHALWNKKSKFIYTRYADDMIISSPYTFKPNKIEKMIDKILKDFNAPFQIKTEKTRYGSSSGRNWNLGIMLNKDNNLTIGHKQNQKFRAMLHNLIKDEKNKKRWAPHEKQVLSGNIAYYKAIEPDYINHTINKYEKKHNVNVNEILKH